MYLPSLQAPSREVHYTINTTVEPFYGTTARGSGLYRLINLHKFVFDVAARLKLYISVYRDVSYQSLHDFFSDELVSEAHQHWDTDLGPFVINLLECRKVSAN